MIPACLNSEGLQEDANAIFHFSVIASPAQGLQSQVRIENTSFISEIFQ